jgi:hypothetical protein
MPKLRAKTVAINSLSDADVQRMYLLMTSTYDAMTLERFQEDLQAKDDVILLLDFETRQIRGFSTLVSVYAGGSDGRRYRGVFSGDTVIHPDYWGGSALGKAFLAYLFRLKIKAPLSPLYWVLISKGYKSYLLMANNFSTYFPRYERETPDKEQAILHAFGQGLFGEDYSKVKGTVTFEESHGHLKTGIAEVPSAQEVDNPRIAFFERLNPGWRQGSELVCISKMTLLMPLSYGLKKAFRFKKVRASRQRLEAK